MKPIAQEVKEKFTHHWSLLLLGGHRRKKVSSSSSEPSNSYEARDVFSRLDYLSSAYDCPTASRNQLISISPLSRLYPLLQCGSCSSAPFSSSVHTASLTECELPKNRNQSQFFCAFVCATLARHL